MTWPYVSVLPTLNSSPGCRILSKFLNSSGDMATLWLLYPLCSITRSIAITLLTNFFGLLKAALVVKNPTASAGDVRDLTSILGSGRSPEGGCGNPLQYSCLENPMDRGAHQAAVHSCRESDRTVVTYHACMH